MRLIDADALKNYIRSGFEDVKHLFKNEKWAEEVVKGFCEDIDEQPTVIQWIPCSERLPKEKNWYLVTGGGDTWMALWNEMWLSATGLPIVLEGITAWMQLPEPWKGEEK